MNINLIVEKLSNYGNCVVAVEEVDNERTGILKFMKKYDVHVAKYIEADLDDMNDIYILEADKEKFTDDVVDEINRDYLRRYSHRHPHPKHPASYRKETLERKQFWEIQELARREFGVQNPELYSKKVLIEIIDEESKKFLEMERGY